MKIEYTGGLTVTVPSSLTNMDYTINGFSIKDTILEAIHYLPIDESMKPVVAQDITDALATKLRLKQG